MIATIGLITLGCFSNYDRGVDPDGDGVPWPNDCDDMPWPYDCDGSTDEGFDSAFGDTGEDCARLVTSLDFYAYDCDSVGYFFDAALIGWGSAPELYIYETGASNPWNEQHPFPADPYEYDPNGCSELYYLELNTVEEIVEVVEGSTTLFNCDHISVLSWLIYIFNVEGDAIECGAWGDNVDAINFFYGTNCPTI